MILLYSSLYSNDTVMMCCFSNTNINLFNLVAMKEYFIVYFLYLVVVA